MVLQSCEQEMVVACPIMAVGGCIRKGQNIDSFGCKREQSRSVQGLPLTGRRGCRKEKIRSSVWRSLLPDSFVEMLRRWL